MSPVPAPGAEVDIGLPPGLPGLTPRVEPHGLGVGNCRLGRGPGDRNGRPGRARKMAGSLDSRPAAADCDLSDACTEVPMAAVTTWEQQIDEWLHSDRKFAETCLLENGSVGRMFTVHTRGGNDVPIHAAWDDAATKASTLALVRVLGLALDAVAIGCVGEAWVVLNPTTGDMETRPASNALRKECVVISIEGRAEGGSGTLRRLAVLEIIRDGGPGGKPVGTRPIEMP